MAEELTLKSRAARWTQRRNSLVPVVMVAGALALTAEIASWSNRAHAQSSSADRSRTMKRGLALMDKGDYYSATLEFAKVIEGQTGDVPEAIQEARLQLAQGLFAIGVPTASIEIMQKLFQSQPIGQAYRDAMAWVPTLAERIGSTSLTDALLPIVHEDAGGPAKPPQVPALELVRYHFARGAAQIGLDAEIERQIAAVAKDSPRYAHMHFLLGTTLARKWRQYVLDADGERDPAEAGRLAGRAVATLRTAARAPEFTGPASLLMARILGLGPDAPQAERMDAARAAYAAAGNAGGALAPKAAFERSLLERLARTPAAVPRAIAAIDPQRLSRVLHYDYCQSGVSSDALANFRAEYPDVRELLVKALDAYTENAEFYIFARQVRAGRAGLSGRAEHLLGWEMTREPMATLLDDAVRLDREQDRLNGTDKTWYATDVATHAIDVLALQQAFAEHHAGQRARTQMAEALRQLDGLYDYKGSVVTVERPGEELLVSRAVCQRASARKPASTGCASCRTDTNHRSGALWLLALWLAVRKIRRITSET